MSAGDMTATVFVVLITLAVAALLATQTG